VPRPRNADFDERILAAASALLAESGYDGLSMTEVARRAGVGKPALYRRFADKGELVLSLVIAASVPPPETDTGSAADDLALALRLLAESLADVPRAALGAQIGLAIAEPEASRRVVERAIGPANQQMQRIWERGVARGELRSDLDAEVALTAVSAGVIHPVLVLHWDPRGAWIDQVIDQFLRGVLAR